MFAAETIWGIHPLYFVAVVLAIIALVLYLLRR